VRPLNFTVRQHVRRFSKAAFALEAVFLAYLTCLPLPFFNNVWRRFVTGRLTWAETGDILSLLIILIGLVTGWRLAFAFLFTDRARFRGLSRGWWISATAVASASLLTLLLMALPALGGPEVVPVTSPWWILSFGILFIPSFIHLAVEARLRAV
jgi:hypothetical protein